MWWFLAVFVAALVVAYLWAPQPQAQKPPGVGEFKVPTAEEGREIGVLFGTRWIESSNIVWYGDLRVTPIKKKGGKK